MIFNTRAIVLKVVPFSETSRIVSWLTAEHGRLTTIIKGSQRNKSLFLGQYDLFYTCELLFYFRLHQGLHIVKECAPLKNRAALRWRWRATACASYFASLLAGITPAYAPQLELFALLDRALDAFAESRDLEMCLYWFELKIISALGIAPQLSSCLQCKRPFNANSDQAEGFLDSSIPPAAPFFSYVDGGVLCAACARATALKAEKVSPDVLNILRFWQRSRSWRSGRNARCSTAQLRSLERLIGLFLGYHLDINTSSRALALEAVRYGRVTASL